MNTSRRIFLFRDLPKQKIETDFRLIDRDVFLLSEPVIPLTGKQTYIESYRFGSDFLITETDYIILPKKLATLRTRIFNHP